MASKDGKKFEVDIKNSCEKELIFFDRIKDGYVPPEYRGKIPQHKNKYDCYIFGNHHLFPVEMKSTQDNKISFSESIIKQHQIDNLFWAAKFEGIIPGFIFNFRSFDNETYFVHINEFCKYKEAVENKVNDFAYVKLNKRSMPIEVCRQIGIKINNIKKKVNYHYFIKEFIGVAVQKYGE